MAINVFPAEVKSGVKSIQYGTGSGTLPSGAGTITVSIGEINPQKAIVHVLCSMENNTQSATGYVDFFTWYVSAVNTTSFNIFVCVDVQREVHIAYSWFVIEYY